MAQKRTTVHNDAPVSRQIGRASADGDGTPATGSRTEEPVGAARDSGGAEATGSARSVEGAGSAEAASTAGTAIAALLSSEADEAPPAAGSLKAVLATEYFLDGLSKVEIGRRHALSRFQVARLLDEARDEGIVRIQIVDPSAAGRDAAPLAQKLGISSVTVATARPGESMRAAIARQVARLLPTRLREGGRLGVAWSRTLMHLPDFLDDLPAADIVQLVGPLSAPGYSTAQSSALVHTLGAHTGGQLWALPTPLIVDSAQVAASLRSMEEVRTALDAADTLDVAVVSIGAWSAGASTLWARLGADEQRRAQDAGIVAEICGIMLGGTGAVWHSSMEDRVIGVRPDQLRRARVIAAAPAVGRPEAVIAAARSGMVDDIVLAPELADQVAALLD
ncbi:sugar-binding transcriptional regulator [Brachybacterium sp. FME24]|uniref:sugar-binding transcriptional regulator n=1 Tax=Brachybacterium sp. FME24 TaxID=2742605 RepID=UPI001868C188|nr:sugar-binding domain-containing protein [Brachybacterium sp. FME24]